MVESPEPEPVGVRVLRRISAAIGPDALRTDFCTLMPRVEDGLVREVYDAMRAKDYVVADRAVDELVWFQRIKPEMCPRG